MDTRYSWLVVLTEKISYNHEWNVKKGRDYNRICKKYSGEAIWLGWAKKGLWGLWSGARGNMRWTESKINWKRRRSVFWKLKLKALKPWCRSLKSKDTKWINVPYYYKSLSSISSYIAIRILNATTVKLKKAWIRPVVLYLF